MTEANRNLLVRVASAGALAPLLVLAIIWQRPEALAAVAHLAVVVGLGEFYWIVLKEDPPWLRVAGIFFGLLISVSLYWWPGPAGLMPVITLAMLAAALLHLFCYGDMTTVAGRTGLMVFGFIYLPVLLTPLALLKRMPDGADWVFLTLTVTWFSDTGAYFTGRALGRHKLYPSISPGKTVEGALGGLAFSVGAAVLAKLWYMPQLTWVDAVLISLPAGALAQCGDLVESMIKRGYGVKDSGRAIPGHGGLLDRIDALLFSLPYIYFYAAYVFSQAAGSAGAGG